MNRVSRRTFLKGACLSFAALSVPDLLRATSVAPDLSPPEEGFPPAAELERILAEALRRGGQYADVYLEASAETHIAIADGVVGSLEYGVLRGGGVRTVAGEKTGYAYAETLSPERLTAAAQTAASIASAGGDVGAVPLEELSVARHIDVRQPLSAASIAEKIALLEEVDRAARTVSSLVQQVVVDYTDVTRVLCLATSHGEIVRDELPLITLRVTVNAVQGGRRSEGASRHSRRAGMEQLGGGLAARAGREAAEQALRMLDARPAPGGELPVVIAAGGGVLFHEAVGHGLEADGVMRNASIFAGRIGQQVASRWVTLYDDGTLTNERGSFNVDDEATPAQRTLLIDRGTLVSYMHDRRTAFNLQARATGNGRRESFRHPVIVRMTNTNLEPGDVPPEEIIRDTGRGVYAVHFGGGEVDQASGQFTFALREAYLIEDGRVTAPIRGANLVGAGIDVLRRIDRVANDFGSWPGTCFKSDQAVPITCGCPTLRIARITVGGTA